MESESDVEDLPGAKTVTHLNGEIQFTGVTFGYENKDKVLRKVDLSIHAGETVALVGPSGAGKMTLCSLLPRFYDVEEGSITIDGMDIREMKLESLRSMWYRTAGCIPV
ncbi:UNVERIFIED_CONTAM: ABC-type multidrug transport system fused ATPase/permease subunit [Paenibacillus sp. PvR008]